MRLGGFFPIRNEKYKTVMTFNCFSALAKCLLTPVFCFQLPAAPARLQLSFNVAACNQVCVAAATFWFLFPLLPLGFCFRRYPQVSVSACNQVCAAAAGSSPPPRDPHNFSKI
ncbi:hypothetical protein [Methanimicrococcus hongohii]|uniref:hypothetical protein n=1 Tax=Methanimicrococcus hongohii TaxID=3028295 RepID=UPI002931E01D|nr:hypothetical protein [Methanimicrococcus sp. Hf6]